MSEELQGSASGGAITDFEVEWKQHFTGSNEEFTIHATLTLPAGAVDKPRAVVILVAGGGPTDRDWCSPQVQGSNGSGRLFAELLTHHGYATLRYDKLFYQLATKAELNADGEGAPPPCFRITMQSSWEELAGAVHYVQQRFGGEHGIDIFALASSEGVIHAINYQLQAADEHNGAALTALDGLVLTGVPGKSLAENVEEQIKSNIAHLPDADEAMRLMMRGVAKQLADEPIDAELAAVAKLGVPAEFVKFLTTAMTPLNSALMKELWEYDTPEQLAELVKSTGNPTLVVIGKRDVQCDWKEHSLALQKALNNADSGGDKAVEFLYCDAANHVMKREDDREFSGPAEAMANYNAEGRVLDSEASDGILEWIPRIRSKKASITDFGSWLQLP